MRNHANSPIYWTVLTHEEWTIHLAATENGLCYVGSPNRPFAEMEAWAAARFAGCTWVRDDEKLRPYAAELLQYLQGERKSFTLPLDHRGTPFQAAVWAALCRIPYGQTTSYSAIAKEIQKPAASRAVGAAIGANPLLILVPCHRVIGKDGKLTGYRGGLAVKTKLLQMERNP
ncbi:methylated-DNA--[protein]-cysteine S-methyltransferase [Brevibacillus composti]|uniref:methylated-DNA--[protein]-cysteine S-methyltransferase n=1 Tax=Brevibacillus composti TaxID=2796470 RepID=A0A7T5EJ26_9BACL|nr:methylated-DNA--[protein]-cysteine S-methyltransferase [Brevibacillus composti]QQE73493.1 methylated-DNA--[protein]-cysteine S-methyltransferase [Brevibacillus composti]QUO40575.1 methylated-DNA--[protein]-cysteine S-methyltransferase [Brevibacillus composti]